MRQDSPVSGTEENPGNGSNRNSPEGADQGRSCADGRNAENRPAAGAGEALSPKDASCGDATSDSDSGDGERFSRNGSEKSPAETQEHDGASASTGQRGQSAPPESAAEPGRSDSCALIATSGTDAGDDLSRNAACGDSANGAFVWDEQLQRTAGRIRFGLKVQLWILGGLTALACICFLFMIFSTFRIVSMVYEGTLSLLEQSVKPLMSFLDAGVYDADSFAALLKSYAGIARDVTSVWRHTVFAFFVILSIPAVVTGIYSVAACLSAQRLKICFLKARQYIWSSLCGRISLLAAVNASACALTVLSLLFVRSSLLLLATFNLCLPLTVWLMLRYFTVRIALNAVTDGRQPSAPSFMAAVVWVGLTLALLFALDTLLLPLAAMLPF